MDQQPPVGRVGARDHHRADTRLPYRPDPDHERLEPWDPPQRRVPFTASQLGEVRHLAALTDPRAMIDRQRDAELVVVAPRGVSHLHQLTMGSTTDWLLHYSSGPIAVIRSGAPTRRVLVCDDGSDHARCAANHLSRLPWLGDTMITVLSVDEGHHEASDTMAGDGPGTIAELLRSSGATVEVRLREGKPTATILAEIERNEPQLVVLGTRGLTGWQRIRLGSTTGAITRVAPCSVMFAALPDDNG